MKPLTVDELARDWLQCSTEVAAQAIASGDLPGLQYGRRWIVPVGALMTRLDELALEDAAKRRAARETPTTFEMVGARSKARVPPALPNLN